MAKSLFKAVALVAIFSIITRALGFFFRIYLSRELGAEMLGIYQISSSVFIVFVLLVSSGLPLTVSKFTAKYMVNNQKINAHKTTTSSLLIGVILSLSICLIVFVFQNFIVKMFADFRCMNILLILLPAVFFSSIYSSLRGYLWGRQDYFSMGYTELVEQVVRIITFFLLFQFFTNIFDGATIAAISMTIACFCSSLLTVFVYFKKGGRLKNPKGYLKPVLKSSIPITGVRTATSLIQPIIAVLFPMMLVLSGYTSENAIAIYGVVLGMTFPLLFLPSTIIGALSFTLIPDLSTKIEQKNTKQVEDRVRTGLLFSVVVSCLMMPMFLGLGVPICEFLFDNSLSGEYLIYASIIMLPMGLSNITSSILNSFNLEVKSFINNIIGGVLLLLFVVCLSGALGAYSLILGFFVCMSTTTMLNIFMIKKHCNIKLNILKPTILCLIFTIPCSLLSKWIYGLGLIVFSNIVSLGIGISVSLLSFVFLCFVFGIVNFTFVFSKIKNITKISRKRA